MPANFSQVFSKRLSDTAYTVCVSVLAALGSTGTTKKLFDEVVFGSSWVENCDEYQRKLLFTIKGLGKQYIISGAVILFEETLFQEVDDRKKEVEFVMIITESDYKGLSTFASLFLSPDNADDRPTRLEEGLAALVVTCQKYCETEGARFAKERAVSLWKSEEKKELSEPKAGECCAYKPSPPDISFIRQQKAASAATATSNRLAPRHARSCQEGSRLLILQQRTAGVGKPEKIIFMSTHQSKHYPLIQYYTKVTDRTFKCAATAAAVVVEMVEEEGGAAAPLFAATHHQHPNYKSKCPTTRNTAKNAEEVDFYVVRSLQRPVPPSLVVVIFSSVSAEGPSSEHPVASIDNLTTTTTDRAGTAATAAPIASIRVFQLQNRIVSFGYTLRVFLLLAAAWWQLRRWSASNLVEKDDHAFSGCAQCSSPARCGKVIRGYGMTSAGLAPSCETNSVY